MVLPKHIECRKVNTRGNCYQDKEKEFVNYCIREMERKDIFKEYNLEIPPEVIFLLYDRRKKQYIAMVGVTRPGIVRKLFVIPSQRRRGFGTYLSLLAKVYILTYLNTVPVSYVFEDNVKMVKFLEEQGMREVASDLGDKKTHIPLRRFILDNFQKFGLMLQEYNIPSCYNEISDLWYCASY